MCARPRRYRALLLALVLTGCGPPIAWVRLDGQPRNEDQFQSVFLQCQREANASAASAPSADAVMQSCMTRAGYFLSQLPVPQ